MEIYIQRKALGRAGIIISLIMFGCGVFACSLDKFYYADKPDPVKAITDNYGPPLWVEVQQNGAEKLVYRIRDPMGGNDYRRYFIIENGKVIGGGIQ